MGAVTWLDPERPSLIDAGALALTLGQMNDDALREAEQAFRMAADGWQVRFAGSEFVTFSNGTRAIPLCLAHIIREYREDGAPLLAALQRLSRVIDARLAECEEIESLEDVWKLEH